VIYRKSVIKLQYVGTLLKICHTMLCKFGPRLPPKFNQVITDQATRLNFSDNLNCMSGWEYRTAVNSAKYWLTLMDNETRASISVSGFWFTL